MKVYFFTVDQPIPPCAHTVHIEGPHETHEEAEQRYLMFEDRGYAMGDGIYEVEIPDPPVTVTVPLPEDLVRHLLASTSDRTVFRKLHEALENSLAPTPDPYSRSSGSSGAPHPRDQR